MRYLTALLVTCGLRDYNLPPTIWGGDTLCEHAWGEEGRIHTGGQQKDEHGGQRVGRDFSAQNAVRDRTVGQFCTKCSAWRGCLGLEPLHDCLGWATGKRCGACYVCHLVEIFREVRRVLRDDGVLFLNLGDSYAGSGGAHAAHHANPGISNSWRRDGVPHWGQMGQPGNYLAPKGLKAKDLCGIPWRVALALQANGWWLRRDIIWAKGLSFCPSYSGSSMPESMRDRPSTSHEYVFLFSKSRRYFYDSEAVKERSVDPADNRKARAKPDHKRMPTEKMAGIRPGSATYPKRNLRSVWAINPKGFKEAHFAVYPEALIRPMILAGTSARGACPECGAPWERVVERKAMVIDRSKRTHPMGRTRPSGTMLEPAQSTTIGWRPTCACPGLDGDSPWPVLGMHPDGEANWPTVPCLVLDPFLGSGTTAVVAYNLGCDYIGIEINPEYMEMANRRLRQLRLL